LEAVFPHFCSDKREIWHGPLTRAKLHFYRGNVSPLRGEKHIFGPLSKNNTGMAALRAGLPVKIQEAQLLLGKPTVRCYF